LGVDDKVMPSTQVRSRPAASVAAAVAAAALLLGGAGLAHAGTKTHGPKPRTTATATATPRPTATPTPSPTPSPSPPATGRVSTCGLSFCLDGSPWRMHAASVLGGLDHPSDTVSMAEAAAVNTLRVTDWLDTSGAVATAPYDETRWRRVDALVSAAGASGLHVVLDLSTYRNLLARNGRNPYTEDWAPFLTWVAARTNTVDGRTYGTDTTIAMVSFAGEVEPVNGSDNTLGVTTGQVTTFYDRVFATWGRLSPGSLRSTGGLLQLDWASGIDWKAITALAGLDVCAIHTYSDADRLVTLPAVSTWCGSLGKPWIDEEFGWEAGIGDAARAADLTDTYRLVRTAGGAGAGIWNLGPQASNPTYDVGPQTPLALAAVRDAASAT